MDLPTYTNIWRIEKRLYKLYDFRLPAPLPITWIAVFAGITVPYIFFLVVIGLPFNHNLVWLYVLPPGVLTWLTTRPVIENKRLPELVGSQLRYLSEPRTWCRMAPFAEKDDVFVSVRVWHRHPPGARPRKARKAAGRARSAGRALEAAGAAQVGASQAAEPAVSQPPASAPLPLPAWSSSPVPAEPLPVPQRATARPGAKRVRAPRVWQRGPGPDERRLALADEPRPGVVQRPSWAVPPPERRQDSRALEVFHDPEPDPRDLAGPGLASFALPSWPAPQAAPDPQAAPIPEVAAIPEAAPIREAAPVLEEPGAVLKLEPLPDPDPAPSVARLGFRSHRRLAPDPAPESPVSAPPGRSVAAKVAALFVDLDGDRPVPSVERALSGPGSPGDASWRRRVKVVAGGQGPSQRDREALDRDRARMPLPGPRRIAVLGCTSGAGQSVIALMTGHTLAAARGVPVAALDLNPGGTSLAARIEPAMSITALLADPGPGPQTDPAQARDQARARPGRARARAGWTSSAATAPVARRTTGGWPPCWPRDTR